MCCVKAFRLKMEVSALTNKRNEKIDDFNQTAQDVEGAGDKQNFNAWIKFLRWPFKGRLMWMAM